MIPKRITAKDARWLSIQSNDTELRKALDTAFYGIHEACRLGHNNVYVPIWPNDEVFLEKVKTVLVNKYGYDVQLFDIGLRLRW